MFPGGMLSSLVRGMATAARGKERKVAVLGAAGGIGQPLSLLMKVRMAPGRRLGARARAAGPRATVGTGSSA
jgi:glycerate kinase